MNAVGTFNVIRLVSEVMSEGTPYNQAGERGNITHLTRKKAFMAG